MAWHLFWSNFSAAVSIRFINRIQSLEPPMAKSRGLACLTPDRYRRNIHGVCPESWRRGKLKSITCFLWPFVRGRECVQVVHHLTWSMCRTWQSFNSHAMQAGDGKTHLDCLPGGPYASSPLKSSRSPELVAYLRPVLGAGPKSAGFRWPLGGEVA